VDAPVIKALGEWVKSTLIGGLLVILPLGLVAMLVMKIVGMLQHVVAPIVERLPGELRFPTVIASALLFIACVAVGMLARTRTGHGAGRYVERAILNHIPGYALVRSFARRLGSVEESEQFAPALVEIEDALVPAFVVEEHADGRYTVFVPSAPTPGVGAIYIMGKARVHLVDASFLTTVKCVSRWGAGSAELVKAIRAPKASDSATASPST
jgi:uncharacterized membrane protein